jgi:hypothetical protein
MCTALESTFIKAVSTAESVRQNSKSVAFASYGFVAGNLVTYIAALSSADATYLSSVATALSAANLSGTIGQSGPLGRNWASIAT